ncbi:hypothetical protein HY468_03805 [Candidatus Roizmanbacteria bacterium]|nr:hypothetical protein [Candidatus Roizmanbacteria bacterium]
MTITFPYLSIKKLQKYAGKWVALDQKTQRVVAHGKTLQDIAPYVSGKKGEEKKITAYAFKVPRKDEGPYVL